MNGTFLITYSITPFGDFRAPSQPRKLDGRKSMKTLIAEADEWTRMLADDAFRIYTMKGGDFTKPFDEFPLYKI